MGVPVLLRADTKQTIGVAERSIALARAWVDGQCDDPLFIDTLGLSEEERARVRGHPADDPIDPVVSWLVGATNGIAYAGRIGQLTSVPIPHLRAPAGEGRRLLDIGCNWGRWSIAAAEAGYRAVGIDPSLGAVRAAKRLAAVRGVPFEGIVGDARHLPFANASFDAAFSYSVLQHFSKPDALQAMSEISSAVRSGGAIRIQMASATGLRSLQHMARRRFRAPEGFEVRYWPPGSLLRQFRRIFGDGQLEVDCYFGLGLQATDRDLYGPIGRIAVDISEFMRKASAVAAPLRYVADSVYLVAKNQPPPASS